MQRAISRAYDYFGHYVAGGIFFGVSLALNILCLVGLILPFRRKLVKPLRVFLFHLFRGWVRLLSMLSVAHVDTPKATEKNPDCGEVWVMNHPSIVDGSYLLSFIRNGACIYKEAIGGNPFYGGVARLADYIPNVGGPDMIRRAVEGLRRGENIVIFPEGTRSTRCDPQAMKPGFALIAKRAQVPINVLWSGNPPDFGTREASKWRPPVLPVSIPIQVLDVVNPRRGETSEQLKDRVAAIFQRQMEAEVAS